MVAPRKTRKVFCTIVRVQNQDLDNGQPSRFSTRPSRLLPWADPCIARLVRKLQDEVRDERAIGSRFRAELDPLPATDPEGEWTESLGWRF